MAQRAVVSASSSDTLTTESGVEKNTTLDASGRRPLAGAARRI
jgi:hypothetical protein